MMSLIIENASSLSVLTSFPSHPCRVYVPRVLDRDSNMHFLHLDSLAALTWAPPFGILEPALEYAPGAAREDLFDAKEPCDMVRGRCLQKHVDGAMWVGRSAHPERCSLTQLVAVCRSSCLAWLSTLEAGAWAGEAATTTNFWTRASGCVDRGCRRCLGRTLISPSQRNLSMLV